MIGNCPNCGNYHWQKEISEDRKRIICIQCNHQWNFNSLPLFILTGCSGVGKTLLRRSYFKEKRTTS
nr:hypothetical protein [uncultured Lachnoclostridium sp.]